MTEKRSIDSLRFLVSNNIGAGLTTLVDALQKNLELRCFSPSSVQRAIAAHFTYEQKRSCNAKTPLHYLWDRFEALYRTAPRPYEIIKPYINHAYGQDGYLNAFNAVRAEYSKPEAIKNFWTPLPDQLSCAALEDYQILEGKLCVVIDQIVKEIPSAAQFLIRIFLTVDPQVAAERAYQRAIEHGNEKKPESDEEKVAGIRKYLLLNTQRTSEDRERFSATHYNHKFGRKFHPDDLTQDGVYVIDTTHLTPEQVMYQVLLYTIKEVRRIGVANPSLSVLAGKIIEELCEHDPSLESERDTN